VRPGPVTVVVTGVSGAGKTTVARALADRLGATRVEGDDLHPAVNVAKMRAGVPLDDEDRAPWLRAVSAVVGEHEAAGRPLVVTCSALRRCYRDVLRAGHPSVRFVHLDVDPAVLRGRLARRTGHFMPASLLQSQLDALEPLEPDEPGTTVDGDAPVAEVVEAAVGALGLSRAGASRASGAAAPGRPAVGR
jgi:gluconokinase